MAREVRFCSIGIVLSRGDAGARAQSPRTTWSDYSGGADSAQYSALRQINRSNVHTLKVAWTYPTLDQAGYSFNPLVVDGVMYVLAKNNAIVALDAATGKELWLHENRRGKITTRGINYWESKDRSDRRLLFAQQRAAESHRRADRPVDSVVRRERPRRSPRRPRPRSVDDRGAVAPCPAACSRT